MKPRITLTALFVSSLILGGCQSTPKIVAEQQADAQATEFFIQAQSAVDGLSQRLIQAKTDNIALYAPELLDDALDQQKDAQTEFDDIRYTPADADQDTVDDILVAVLKANQALDSGYLIKQTAEKVLADAMAMRERLQQLDAASYFGKQMRRAEQQYLDLLEEVADGDIEDAQEGQAELIKLLNAIEVKTVERLTLTGMKKQLASMQKNRVARSAPLSFQRAVASMERAKSVIASDPRNDKAIDAAATQVQFDLDHAQHIAQAVKNLDALDDDDFESYILAQENRLNQVVQALGSDDVRDRPFSQQTQAIVEVATKLTHSAAQQQVEIERLMLALASQKTDSPAQEAVVETANNDPVAEAQVDAETEIETDAVTVEPEPIAEPQPVASSPAAR
ncbi:hypothetical protein SAMN04488540_12316 [Ferrimonas sediminum]|uniref:Uncharacterized protein n=1 Tax=Ferrimonas sediminum TaxID=718193 RepID=A0A1G9AEL6_9GAMM|nr:hypothetical protein [Ferrimonas sediminum]SDK25807.1 hypothetical protein SAMN04488540_12316 [Ferrimonas sediminum]